LGLVGHRTYAQGYNDQPRQGTNPRRRGAVVPNATVTATNIETTAVRTVSSDNQGFYIIPGLQPGSYEVSISSPNFAAAKQKAQVTVGGQIALAATLGVAGGQTTVEVSSEAVVEINTQTQETSQVISQQQIAELPSLTRNPYDFVALAGNISGGDRSAQSGNPQTSGGGQNMSDREVGYFINSQRSSGTEILLDGVENPNIFDTTIALEVPQGAVNEFRVVTNNFDAQYGRASAWEFNRLSAYTPNQFGFTAGGPIFRNKLFFCGGAEWLPFVSTVSKADLAGKFTPGGLFDTAITNPNTPVFGLVNYFAPFDAGGDSPQNTYDLTFRVDYIHSGRGAGGWAARSRALVHGALFSCQASVVPQTNHAQRAPFRRTARIRPPIACSCREPPSRRLRTALGALSYLTVSIFPP
jgi:hypothetical protein